MQTAIASVDNNSAPSADGGFMPYERLRKQFLDWANVKRDETNEQREARRYYHSAHYTDDQLKVLKKRKQPPVVYNRIGKKIDGIVGLMERLRQDAKAFPRTPQHEEGAEIASVSIRYALDSTQWPAHAAEAERTGAVDGIGGVELSLEPDNLGDHKITLSPVDTDTFFYDPRSFRHDFSDARFMGVAKWMDLDAAQAMFPEHADALNGLLEQGGDVDTNAQQDRERKWIDSELKRVFVIEHWYKQIDPQTRQEEWCWCFYVKGMKLSEGKSPFYEDDGRTISRFLMFSANVDHHGDRYGFIRNMKSPQDEINARRSKALHLIHSRRILARRGSLSDPEKARREAARPDGLIEWDVEKPEFEDVKAQADFRAQFEMLQEAKAEIDTYGPNPQLVGETRGEKSGRAIALLQQAGIAELGPYIRAVKDWKLRVYRAVWCSMRRYWKAERWVRVTDDEGAAQFVKVNELVAGPYGVQMQNALGELDVDIILDEGPDNINAMQDAFDILVQGLAQNGVPVPPQALIELAQLPASMKKRILEYFQQSQQPNPIQQQAAMLEIEDKRAQVGERKAKTVKTLIDAAQIEQDMEMRPLEYADGRQDAQQEAARRFA